MTSDFHRALDTTRDDWSVTRQLEIIRLSSAAAMLDYDYLLYKAEPIPTPMPHLVLGSSTPPPLL